jgi:hypothetical protein
MNTVKTTTAPATVAYYDHDAWINHNANDTYRERVSITTIHGIEKVNSSSGRWKAVYEILLPNGHTTHTGQYFWRKAEAQAWLRGERIYGKPLLILA